MSKTIPDLRRMWNREKESYETQEVGSGVQGFVKSVLECPDVFNLKEGALSTPIERRKNEFIYEKRTKERRRADFVIYVNSEITIPVEVEQYTRIKQGEKQLAQYQSDLDRKYGLLTDGFTWRFYNNNIYRPFTLDEVFSDTSYFLEFWKEYIKPENYYLAQFGQEIGQLPLFEKTELRIEDNRQLFFSDITRLIGSFKHKLRLEGYIDAVAKKESGKRATEITYAYIIQYILYKTLVDNRFEEFGDDYKSRLETIQNAIKSHSYKDILGVIDGMSCQISESVYHPFAEEQQSIRNKLVTLMHKAKNQLSDVSPWLDIVVFIKKYSFQNISYEIFGYVYENYLKEIYEEQKMGQYFTDPDVVGFMLEQIGYTAEAIRKKIEAGELGELSIVDPACGSGTFLYSATNEIVRSYSKITRETSKEIEEIVSSNVFGLDIEEFPLYLAEMSILMRLLPLILGERYNTPVEKKIKVFLTRDSIAEFAGSGLEYTDTDVGPASGQRSYFGKMIRLPYSSYVRDEDDLAEMIQSMIAFPRRRFDYVVANPPYISYNECASQGVLFFQMLKEGTVKLSDVYGVNLHSTPGNRKKYPPKPNLYAFFIALGLTLLKDEAKLCYIIPQNILTAGDLDVLRYHLSKYVTIERIITFNNYLFIERGLKQSHVVPTSSLVIVVRKCAPRAGHQVEVINYTGTEMTTGSIMAEISTGKNTDILKVRQSQLLDNATNWSFIRFDKTLHELLNEYERNTEPMSRYYEHSVAQAEFGSRFYFDIGFILDSKLVSHSGDPRRFFELLDFKTFSGFSRFVPSAYYPRDRDTIQLTKNSQGYVTLEQKYKIVWRIKNPDRFCITERDIVFHMGRAGIICSDDNNEILYLLSLLNSPLSRLILERKASSETEKEYLVPIKAIKQIVRVPIITSENTRIKDEVINRTAEMIELERKTLSDYVDLSGVLLRAFDGVQVEGDNLILLYDTKRLELPIKRQAKLVANSIAEQLGGHHSEQEGRPIRLYELCDLPIVDHRMQKKLKAYVDDLVFALYFGIRLQELGLRHAATIRKTCRSNRYYEYILKG